MEDKAFQAMLDIGKKTEQLLSSYLKEQGYIVKDISKEVMPNGHYSPFDLLAVRDGGVFVIDAKARTKRRYWFTEFDLLAWELYDTSATKWVVFVTPSILSFRYVAIPNIRELSYHKKSNFTFHIDYKDTIEL